jgi:hypothetical protein
MLFTKATKWADSEDREISEGRTRGEMMKRKSRNTTDKDQ